MIGTTNTISYFSDSPIEARHLEGDTDGLRIYEIHAESRTQGQEHRLFRVKLREGTERGDLSGIAKKKMVLHQYLQEMQSVHAEAFMEWASQNDVEPYILEGMRKTQDKWVFCGPEWKTYVDQFDEIGRKFDLLESA